MENIVAYAHKRDMKIVAEGLETPEEIQKVLELEVDLLQGFYLARPEPVPGNINAPDDSCSFHVLYVPPFVFPYFLSSPESAPGDVWILYGKKGELCTLLIKRRNYFQCIFIDISKGDSAYTTD